MSVLSSVDTKRVQNNHPQLVVDAQKVLDRLCDVASVPCVLQAVESDQTLRFVYHYVNSFAKVSIGYGLGIQHPA